MKIFLILSVVTTFLISCNNQPGYQAAKHKRLDSLEKKLNDSYKPGLGEFMSDIQVHHDKLWFAGENKNWALADFEMNEIKEAVGDIEKYCADRVEVKFIPMINPALDSLNHSIEQKNLPSFNSSFMLLTNTCNSCHRITNHEFNVIKIPDSPPFSNQVFTVQPH